MQKDEEVGKVAQATPVVICEPRLLLGDPQGTLTRLSS